MQTLEQKAFMMELKTSTKKKVYDGIAADMKQAMKAEPFLSRTAAGHKNEVDLVRLDVTHK